MNRLEVHGSHQCCDSVENDGKVFKPIKILLQIFSKVQEIWPTQDQLQKRELI